MSVETRLYSRSPLRPATAIALGALIVGALDILDAIIFFGLRGATPLRIFQSIASGLLGRASFGGGLATGALGAFLHFFIASTIVATYFFASRKLRSLTARPFLYGPVYGVAVYLVMNLIVVPLSAATAARKSVAVIINGLLINVCGVGLPTAICIRACRPAGPAATFADAA
jgi:hypothetical protein